jgi:hypothetical protein
MKFQADPAASEDESRFHFLRCNLQELNTPDAMTPSLKQQCLGFRRQSMNEKTTCRRETHNDAIPWLKRKQKESSAQRITPDVLESMKAFSVTQCKLPI